ncbi:cache domain-containing sensor histidine kinase [Paenibacillus sp. JDR-2]|uniref:cache domain-containing sensor histidine kinase n=1 Tax=Paenibacillus sp. (strain JDR-2) TaxID=324057 RepID=UPI0001AAF812|nr:histidine kinase [Paenibacillus sp. JDR-2]ACS99835.1 histidine kinase [Paenibacillus sp. JDR-2]
MYKRMIAYTLKYRLSYMMIVTNICIAILPLSVLGTIGSIAYMHTLKQNALDNMEQFVSLTNSRFDDYLKRIDQLSKAVFYNPNIQQIAISDTPWQESQSQLKNMSSYMSIDPTIKSIGLIDIKGSNLVATGQVLRKELAFLLAKNEMNAISPKIQISPPIEGTDKKQGLLAYRQVKSIYSKQYLQDIYVGVILLDIQWIQNILQTGSMGGKADLFIVNGEGDLIGSSSDRMDYEQIRSVVLRQPVDSVADIRLDGESYLYQSLPIESLNWKFIALIEKDKLFEKANFIQLTVLVVVAIAILVVAAAAVSFNVRLTHPITRLVDAFDSAASGNLDVKLKFTYKNEITVIQNHFNHMLQQIKKLTVNLLQSQQQLHQTEMDKQLFQLKGLQSQINAHFLYNVLHAIRGMSMSNAKKEVAEAIDNLVQYFRYIVRYDEYVLLRKELEHLERYIAIQKIRYGDRLQFKVDMDPSLNSRSIVKLILQPLVENSLMHGLEDKNGRWIIRIRAYAEDHAWKISVMDNGLGMTEEKLECLREEIAGIRVPPEKESAAIGQGIGLVNIHKRIQIYYGEPYGLSVRSWENKGTVVTITIPLNGKEDDDVV